MRDTLTSNPKFYGKNLAKPTRKFGEIKLDFSKNTPRMHSCSFISTVHSNRIRNLVYDKSIEGRGAAHFCREIKVRPRRGLRMRRKTMTDGGEGSRTGFVAQQFAKKAERCEIRRALNQTRCTERADGRSRCRCGGEEQPRYREIRRCNLDFRALTRYAYGVNELTGVEFAGSPPGVPLGMYIPSASKIQQTSGRHLVSKCYSEIVAHNSTRPILRASSYRSSEF